MEQETSKARVGKWQVTLHRPVLAYRGTPDEHITRPNLCHLGNGAIGLLVQQSMDYNDVTADQRVVLVSLDEGATWEVKARNVDVGSFTMISTPVSGAVVLPYDSFVFGDDNCSFTGPRTELAWHDSQLEIKQDRITARFPRPLMTFLQGPIDEPYENTPPLWKPITDFWGSIEILPDGSWIAPAYGCYADDERTPLNYPLMANRRFGRTTNDLMHSTDEGRNWAWCGTIATPRDVPEGCLEGPGEAKIFLHDDRWRAVYRTSAILGFCPLYWSDSFDEGHTWTHPQPLESVAESMDPRGHIAPDGLTLLSAGRKGFELYLAESGSLDFAPCGMIEHHNAHYGEDSMITRTYAGGFGQMSETEVSNTTSHTDILALAPRTFLFAYDFVSAGWRQKDMPADSPRDEIYIVRIEIE